MVWGLGFRGMKRGVGDEGFGKERLVVLVVVFSFFLRERKARKEGEGEGCRVSILTNTWHAKKKKKKTS